MAALWQRFSLPGFAGWGGVPWWRSGSAVAAGWIVSGREISVCGARNLVWGWLDGEGFMSESDIFERLRGVVAETFEVDPASVTPATTAAGVAGWNSLSRLISRLRQELKDDR